MTEKEIQLLGMSKEFINDYEGDETYYYVLNVVDGLSFITNTNDQVKDNNWEVDVFNTEPAIRFDNFVEVQSLLNKLTKAIVKDGQEINV